MKRKEVSDLNRISSYQYDNIFDVIQDDDGNYFYNMYNSVYIDDDISPALYKEHVFSSGDYWTKLADTYYGDPKLWWLILVTNKINNPLDLPEPGTRLKILSKSLASEIISKILNGN